MITFFCPVVAVVLLGQAPNDRELPGTIVDEQGKPVIGAQVVFYSPPTVHGRGDSVELATVSDAQGKFSVKMPALKRILVNGVNFMSYRPGLA